MIRGADDLPALDVVHVQHTFRRKGANTNKPINNSDRVSKSVEIHRSCSHFLRIPSLLTSPRTLVHPAQSHLLRPGPHSCIARTCHCWFFYFRCLSGVCYQHLEDEQTNKQNQSKRSSTWAASNFPNSASFVGTRFVALGSVSSWFFFYFLICYYLI